MILQVRWPNQQCQSTEGQQLVGPPGKEPIQPGQALYKVKWSMYNLKKNTCIRSEDTEVLGGVRARPNEIKHRSNLKELLLHC